MGAEDRRLVEERLAALEPRVLRSASYEVPLSALKVVGVCSRCHPGETDPARLDVRLVSPRGLVHEGEGYGMTACGRDATGDGWWWAL